MSTIKTILRFVGDVLSYALRAPIVGLYWVLALPERWAADRTAAAWLAIQALEDEIAELTCSLETWKQRRREYEAGARGAHLPVWNQPQYRVMCNTIDALESQIHDLTLQLDLRK